MKYLKAKKTLKESVTILCIVTGLYSCDKSEEIHRETIPEEIPAEITHPFELSINKIANGSKLASSLDVVGVTQDGIYTVADREITFHDETASAPIGSGPAFSGNADELFLDLPIGLKRDEKFEAAGWFFSDKSNPPTLDNASPSFVKSDFVTSDADLSNFGWKCHLTLQKPLSFTVTLPYGFEMARA